jgi:hypothetical protein
MGRVVGVGGGVEVVVVQLQSLATALDEAADDRGYAP